MTQTDRWKNRRAMAWLSLVAGLLFPVGAFVSDSVHVAAVVAPFYLFVGSVVTAYIGFATADDKWQKPDV